MLAHQNYCLLGSHAMPAIACFGCNGKNWNSMATPAQANSVKAYLAKQSINDRCVFNAQQIEKAMAGMAWLPNISHYLTLLYKSLLGEVLNFSRTKKSPKSQIHFVLSSVS